MPIWRVCLYSTKQQETKNIQSKRAKCLELEKRNFNWIEELWLLGLVEKEKETRKNIMTLKIKEGSAK